MWFRESLEKRDSYRGSGCSETGVGKWGKKVLMDSVEFESTEEG